MKCSKTSLGMGLLAAGILMGWAASAGAVTVTWTDADETDSLWSTGGNWSGGAPGTADTALFTNQGLDAESKGASRLDGNRSIAGLLVRNPDVRVNGADFAHLLNLDGNRLTVDGDVEIGRYTITVSGGLPANLGTVTLTVTNGTFQVGTAGAARNLTIGRGRNYTIGAQLLLAANTTLQGHFDTIVVPGMPIGATDANRTITGLLDLRQAALTDGTTAGVFAASNLYVAARSAHHVSGLTGQVLFGTALNAIRIADKLIIGRGVRFFGYLGVRDSNGTAAMPDHVDIEVGSQENRGTLNVAHGDIDGNTQNASAHLVAGNGGAFTAYLTSLMVGRHGGWDADKTASRNATGILDLRNMDEIVLDVDGDATIGESRTEADYIKHTANGYVHLPPGTAVFNNLSVGPAYGSGLLDLYGTEVTVTNALAVSGKGTITVRSGAAGGSLTVNTDDAPGDAIAIGGKIRVLFTAPAAGGGAQIGLRWKGNRVTEIVTLIGDNNAANRISYDDTAETLPRPAQLYLTGGYTVLGLPPPSGTVVFVQ